MTKRFRSALVLVSVTMTAGCNQSPGPSAVWMCTGVRLAGLTVDVRDSTTDAPVGPGARIIARTGALADTLDVPAVAHFVGPYALAHEQPGTYTVTVEQEGYRTWSTSGIRVTADECHVRTASVLARLQR